jgi:citrate lyase gamma subunit
MLLKYTAIHKNIMSALVLLIVLAAACYVLTVNLRPVPDPADLVPANTVAFVKVNDLADMSLVLKDSPVGKQLVAPELGSVLDQLGTEQRLQEKILKTAQVFKELVEHPLLHVIFGRQAALAFLPSEIQADIPANHFAQNLVLVAQAKLPIAPGLLFSRLVPGIVATGSTHYHGTTITSVALENGITLYYAFLEQSLIMGLDPRPVQRCISLAKDRLLRSGLTLYQDKAYKQVVGKTQRKEGSLLYVNLVSGALEWAKLDENSDSRIWVGEEERLFLLQRSENNKNSIRMVLKGYGQRPTGIVQHYQLASPVINSHLQQISSGTAVYFWSNWLDFSKYWLIASLAPTLKTATVMFYIAQQFYEHTGIDISTFSSQLGEQFGFFIKEVPSATFATVPMVCLQFQVRDPAALKKLLEKQLRGVKTHITRLGDIEAVSVVMAGGLIQPTYIITDEWLIIADHVNQIKEFLDSSKKTLLADEAFIQVDNGFTRKSNVLLYARIDKVNQGLLHLFFWGINAMEGTHGLTLKQRSLLMERFVLPMFESLARVRSQGVRVVSQAEDLVVELDLLYTLP